VRTYQQSDFCYKCELQLRPRIFLGTMPFFPVCPQVTLRRVPGAQNCATRRRCRKQSRERREDTKSKLTLKADGGNSTIVTRRFAATPEAVYRAHAEPSLLQRWLLGPEGWTMPVSISEARLNGRIRYEWSNGKGGGFFLTGESLDLEPFRRIVHVERMHMPDATPDNHVETRFDADGTGTLMTMRMTLHDSGTRAATLATGMEHGMEASYARLEGMIAASLT
jgi:uncharacterized protein YndB with AHSA1/START domain